MQIEEVREIETLPQEADVSWLCTTVDGKIRPPTPHCRKLLAPMGQAADKRRGCGPVDPGQAAAHAGRQRRRRCISSGTSRRVTPSLQIGASIVLQGKGEENSTTDFGERLLRDQKEGHDAITLPVVVYGSSGAVFRSWWRKRAYATATKPQSCCSAWIDLDIADSSC